MQVHVEHGLTFAIVRPVGSFYGGDETRDLEHKLGAIVDGGVPVVVVDLSRTRDLNSTAIGILVGAYRRGLGRDSEVRLASPGSDLANVLAILKLVNVIPVFADVPTALAARPRRRLEPAAAAAAPRVG